MYKILPTTNSKKRVREQKVKKAKARRAAHIFIYLSTIHNAQAQIIYLHLLHRVHWYTNATATALYFGMSTIAVPCCTLRRAVSYKISHTMR